MIKKIFLSILFSFSPFLLHAANIEAFISNMDLIKSIFEVKYAPAEWKKSYAGWDLESEVQTVKNAVQKNSSLTNHEYQKLLVNFFQSMQDYHVAIQFYATEMSLLPFRVQGVDGRYYVAWVDNPTLYRNVDPHLAEMLTHMKIGDEMISFGGVPTDECVRALRKISNGTDQMLAEKYLTFRLASMGNDVEQGSVEIVVKHRTTEETQTYTPNWLYIPEKIKNPTETQVSARSVYKKKENLFDKVMMTPLYAQFEQAES